MKSSRINHSLPLVVVLALLCLPAIKATDEKNELVERARALTDQGKFSEAEALLRENITSVDGPVIDDYAVALETIRRIRLDYSLAPEEILTKIRGSIPDVTAEDLERWRQQGVLQHRMIDGEVRYFGREPSNLFRFCEEARSRRKADVQPAGWKFDLPEHLAQLVAEAERSDNPQIHPVKHRIRYALRVKEGHPRLRPGAKVRCWLPFPQEYRQQRDVNLISTDPPDAIVAPNGHPQRTVYFEQIIEDPSKPPKFVAEFEFVTYAYVPKLDPARVKAYDTEGAPYREFTAERPPHVVFTPDLRQIVNEIVGDEINPLLRARRIFRWIDTNVRYCSEVEYSTIPNISGKALSTRKGDCGVQGLLFITMCRAAGIPARWQSGWETLPNSWNMHDWAEFYVEPWGWLPADPSYGLKEHDDPRVREFYCGHMDAYRMIVNLDYARELYPLKISFRSEPNDFQRGEIEIDGRNLYYDEWDWSFDVRTIPLEGGMASLEEAFDAIVPDALKEGNIPGAVILVGRAANAGYETWQKAYGFLQTEPQRVPMREDAIFDMASLTKPIATGTSLMILAEQGKLGLDDPVGKYLPEFNEGDKKNVTIRQLMTHMSGMPAYVGAEQQKIIKDKAGFPCPAATRAYIRSLELARPPGEAMVYSCLNAILCAEIVEAVSGQPLDQFATERIFKPLGMKESGFCRLASHDSTTGHPERSEGSGHADRGEPDSSVAALLRNDSGRFVPTTKADWGCGAGGFLQGQVHDPLAAMQAGVSGNAGLFSTAADLSRFAQMMLNGGELDGVRILKEETIRAMTSVQNPGAKNLKGQLAPRGLLWGVYIPNPGDTGVDALSAYGHTGYTGCAIQLYPEHEVYAIALTNRVHPDDSGKVEEFRQEVWRTVAQLLMGVRVDLP
jgi:CubicO group peptidase (beta-lactamase class C family)